MQAKEQVARPDATDFSYDVVIPTHGRQPQYVAQAIASVDNQTFPPERIIVVVDGNPSFAETLRNSMPTLTVSELPPHSGAAAARQAGIEVATAEWVCFLDDDDVWAPTKQERTAEYLQRHPDCAAVRAGYWMFAAPDAPVSGLNGQKIEVRGRTTEELVTAASTAERLNDLSYLDIYGDSLGMMLEYNRGVISTSMVRRDVLTRIPSVPPGQRPGDDYMLFTHVAAATEWHLVEERLSFYRVHPGQDTSRRDVTAARCILHAKSLLWQEYREDAPRPLEAYGPAYRAEARQLLWPLVKHGTLREAFRTYREALTLLPNRKDRLIVLVPDPLAWRLKRLQARLSMTNRRTYGPTRPW